MILVVDSGATSSSWKFIEADEAAVTVKRKGINLSTHSLKDFQFNFPSASEKVEKIFFFGAGTGDPVKESALKSKLGEVFFKVREIRIGSDLLSAGLALSPGHRSVISILGTGSNCCIFSGNNIDLKTKNLGYILGDEGSGYAMGREVLRHYFYDRMPESDRILFKKTYELRRDDLVKEVYHSEGSANTYIARYCEFLSHSSLELRKLIAIECLGSFFELHLRQYEEAEILEHHFSGSISWHFRDEIREMCGKYGFKLGNIIQNPIDSLSYTHLAEI